MSLRLRSAGRSDHPDMQLSRKQGLRGPQKGELHVGVVAQVRAPVHAELAQGFAPSLIAQGHSLSG